MKKNSIWFLIKSSLITLILSAIPIFSNEVIVFWPLLSFSYWLIRFKIKNPAYYALVLGILIDVISGDILGQNSLALILSSLFLIKIKRSFFTSNISTEQVYIFVASIIYLTVIYTVHLISITEFYINPVMFISLITTPLFWPIIRWLLDSQYKK